MTKESVLLALVRHVICGAPLEEEVRQACTEDMLVSLRALAKKQDLDHLAGHALSRLDLPDSKPLEAMKQAALLALSRQLMQEFELDKVCKVLEEAGIDYIPLKGTVLRAYYPESWMRTSCDIDILVREETLDAAVQLLLDKLQYTNCGKGDHDVSLYAPSGVHVELHYDTVQERYAASDCRDVLAQIWDCAIPKAPDSCHYLLPDELFYFYHMAHMAKHFEVGGCGIRPFLDIWIMDHRMPHDSQKREQLLQEGGLLKFAQAARRVAQFWFEGEEPQPMDLAISDYILRAGLYGDNENRAALGQAKAGGKWKYLLTQRVFMPYDYLKAEYPVLKKHSYLTPVYQVVRWGRMLCSGRLKATMRELQANVAADSTTIPAADILKHLGISK